MFRHAGKDIGLSALCKAKVVNRIRKGGDRYKGHLQCQMTVPRTLCELRIFPFSILKSILYTSADSAQKENAFAGSLLQQWRQVQLVFLQDKIS